MKTLLLLLIVSVSSTAFAQSSSRFTITRSVAAGGGLTSTNSRFQVVSTIGQPVPAVPTSGRFSIQSGFLIRPAPIFFAPTATGTNFTISIQSELGETYTVQYLDSLSGSSWENLTSFTGNGSVMTVTNSALGVANRFYRLVQQ